MKDTAPISQGIIAVAGLFAIVATGVAYVAYDFWFFTSAVIGGTIGLVAAIVLALGWRAPAEKPMGGTTVITTPALQDDPAPAAPTDSVAAATAAPAAASMDTGASAAATPAPMPAAEPEPVAQPDPAPTASVEATPAATPATDGPAMKPAFLESARDGGPDDLKLIKGVGPKLETTLHEMGIYHYDQIAAWGPAEQAWMDDHLEGFKGRATRDEWVAQAKILAAGGSTEFSARNSGDGV